jgi:DNA-binding NarL/FixJ family response regulator
MTNILIADDQKLLRESFKYILENNTDMKVIGCVANGQEAVDFCSKFIPDVILMDILMPVCNGIEATKLIKAKYPNVKVLILTSSTDIDDVSEAIHSGADGYILKDMGAEELILSVKSTAIGLGIINKAVLNSVPLHNKTEKRTPSKQKVAVNNISIELTDKELKIIDLIVAGNDNKQISELLFVAEGTVKNKITEINSKLQLKDRTQLAVFAIKHNLV